MLNQKSEHPSPIVISPLKGAAPKSAEVCPKCSSVFVTSTHCESCGLQLSFDPYGEPLDEKSFYSMRDSYLQAQKILGLHSTELWNKLYPEKRRQYKRNLIHRYRLLVDYFTLETPTDRRRKIFLIELQDMIIELVKLNVDRELLWEPLDILQSREDQNLLQMINQAIMQGQMEVESSASETFLTKKWFGVLSTTVAIRVALFCVAMIALGIAYFKYLTI